MDRVTTSMRMPASPTDVWQRLMFYEDVPRRPWLLLRFALPQPLRSEGDKGEEGSRVRCTYERGFLVKCITDVRPHRRLGFEVEEQALGIESRVRAAGGSYDLRPTAGGTELVLMTRYHSRMRPRLLWRPLEHLVGHALHRHILRGVRDALSANPVTDPEQARAAATAPR